MSHVQAFHENLHIIEEWAIKLEIQILKKNRTENEGEMIKVVEVEHDED